MSYFYLIKHYFYSCMSEMGFNRKPINIQYYNSVLYCLNKIYHSTNIQMHLNALECRGKVHLFQ